jgi:hypothetical protein
MSNSSIGRGPAFGGNENHDGDPQSKTLGESVHQEPPAGNDVDELADEAHPDQPAGGPGVTPKPDAGKLPSP